MSPLQGLACCAVAIGLSIVIAYLGGRRDGHLAGMREAREAAEAAGFGKAPQVDSCADDLTLDTYALRHMQGEVDRCETSLQECRATKSVGHWSSPP